MNRLIEMLPPTVDSERMKREHIAYMISSLVLRHNMHAWTNTSSCFKASRVTKSRAICRYGFSRARCFKSSITGPTVSIKRGLAHEYINGYNPTIMAAFKCNHDIQVLFGGKEAINRIYYCCKYVTKSQRQIDSTTAVALGSFQRRQTKEATEAASEVPPSIEEIQRRRVTGLVHTYTNKQEVAGPLAALYVLRGSCCYSCTKCVRLPFFDVLRQLESREDYNCTLVEAQTSVDTVFKSASYLDDYIYRPEFASGLNLYEYAMKCYRRRVTQSVSASLRFSDAHPLSASHCVGARRVDAVPVITGPRLPRLKEEMSTEDKLQYARLALVLFKPFRTLSDLIAGGSWLSAYEEWEPTRTEFTMMVMSNMNDYHVAQAAENDAEVTVTDGEEREASQFDSDCSSSDDGYGSEGFVEEDRTHEGSQFDLLFDDVLDDETDEVEAFPSPATYSAHHQLLLDQFERHQLVRGLSFDVLASRESGRTNSCVLSVDRLKTWVEDNDTDSRDALPSESEVSDLADVGSRDTTVNEFIDTALTPNQMIWEPRQPAPLPQDIPIFSGIGDISRMFTLNELQHGAFAIVATHLLRRWKLVPSVEKSATSSDVELDSQQLRMFLGGEGGTGKSRVIQSIQGLCQSWQRPSAVVTSAMTGKAASIINGRTLASFEMALKRASSHTFVQDVDCLIVDEVSMMKKSELAKLDVLLRKAKRISDVAFGGIHVILVGDFLQLPPVRADPLFVDPASKANTDFRDGDGFKLWQRFDKVVVLRESVRFKDDPEWGAGCSKARYGEWTPAFVELINSRYIDCENVALDALPLGTVFVTPDNNTRTVINSHFVATTARCVPTGEFPIRVVANFKGALNKLSSSDIAYIMSLPDSRFGRMAPYLDLIAGMPIQITQNVRTKKGVANGTVGTLHSLHFPANTSFRKVLDRRNHTVVLLPDKRPTHALVALDRGRDSIALADGIDPRLFPVFPDAEPYSKEEIDLVPSASGETRKLKIKIQQFPFVCAVGATVYKVQGESLKSMVVVDWKSGKANQRQQAYLIVSRVVTRQAMLCMKQFTSDLIAWFKPPANAVDEDRRLRSESIKTLTNFYQEVCQRNEQ